jgi:NAD(P)-dependent dehydrogenase (short-subunit alcohol dehydrogenase family)
MGNGFGTSGPGDGRLDERTAIVTGGASGIGHATAVRLAELGAQVVVTDIDEAGGALVAEEIGGSFGMLDVGDPEAWQRIVATFGPFDIAFLNAGIATNQGLPPQDSLPIVDLADHAYRRIMSINVDGVVFGTRAVLPGMIERGAGDIVATASMAGLGPIGFDPIYGLTKHAVVGFVRSMAAAFDQTPDAPDICISAVCPGFTDTNIIGDEVRLFIEMAGIEIMPTDHVADVVARALAERVQGAQWVIWPGIEARVYEWNPPVTEAERGGAVHGAGR